MIKNQFLGSLLAGVAATATAVSALNMSEVPALAQSDATSAPYRSSQVGIPKGYTGFLVYLANGFAPPGEDLILGQAAINLFHKGVMNYTDGQIAAERQEAIAFFRQRFGINLQNTADYQFAAFTLNPQLNYRAYVVGGERVPKSGWIVRDGGWVVLVRNPKGVTLGGEFAGRQVPAGTGFVFGNYNILTNQRGINGKAREILISFKSGIPIVVAADGSFAFGCDLYSKDYGIGKAQGFVDPFPVPQNSQLLRANYRNVLTFSKDGGL